MDTKTGKYLKVTAPDRKIIILDFDSIPSSKWNYLKSPYVIVSSTAVVVAITLLTVFLVVNLKPSSVDPEGGESDPPLPADWTLPLVRRKQWSAVKPNYPVPPLRSLPARYALVETTGGYQCLNTHRCSQVVLSIQAARVFNGLNDIAYNFLVGGDGLLYEGLGWNKAGYSAGSLNSYAISVAFVGNFTLDLPNPQQINSTKLLLEGAVRANQLAPDYKLMLVSQVAEGDTAGPRLTSLVRSWPHWSECDPVCQQIKKADEQDDF